MAKRVKRRESKRQQMRRGGRACGRAAATGAREAIKRTLAYLKFLHVVLAPMPIVGPNLCQDVGPVGQYFYRALAGALVGGLVLDLHIGMLVAEPSKIHDGGHEDGSPSAHQTRRLKGHPRCQSCNEATEVKEGP